MLLYVLTNHLDLAVRSLSKFVDYQVRVISTEVVEKDRDSETYLTLQVALAESGAEDESGDVVVVTDFRPFRIALLESVAADVALRRVLILLPLICTHALHRSIRPKFLHNRRLPLDEHVQELGERIFSNLHDGQLIR